MWSRTDFGIPCVPRIPSCKWDTWDMRDTKFQPLFKINKQADTDSNSAPYSPRRFLSSRRAGLHNGGAAPRQSFCC